MSDVYNNQKINIETLSFDMPKLLIWLSENQDNISSFKIKQVGDISVTNIILKGEENAITSS